MPDASGGAAENITHAGMKPECPRRLNCLTSDRKMGVLRRALTGEPATDMDPLHGVFKPDEANEHVRARPRSLSPEGTDWMEDKMQRLVVADMVRPSRHVICSSMATEEPEGRGYRMVAGCRAANAQVELVLRPMPDLEAMVSRFGRVPPFCSLALSQGYWQMPLAEDA